MVVGRNPWPASQWVVMQIIAFGKFHLSVTQRVLMEGNRRVPLGSRALEALLVLLEHAGEVVTKSYLMERIWPGIVVEEGTLRVHIAALRKVLGDDRSGIRFIENVTGHGYRFVAPVVPFEPPVPARDLIGRQNTVASLVKQLPERRVVTVTGPGGMGKTTVALEAARRVGASFADGVYCVDLSRISDPACVSSTVAAAFQLPGLSEDPLPQLLDHLAPQQLLLVLDSCEHVIHAATELVEAVVRRSPRVHVLATSREPLRTEGEWVYRLGPLELPERHEESTSQALGYAAVRLFVERALAASNSFELRDGDTVLVAQICRELDGLPLAIELAAACTDRIGLRALAGQLGERLQILKNSRRTAPLRQHTLRSNLEWSHEILTPAEQRLLRRLAVFTCAFDSTCAVAVGTLSDLDPTAIQDHLADLASKSLLVTEVRRDEVFYRLPATTRVFALEKLISSGELLQVRRRRAELLAQRILADVGNEVLWRDRDQQPMLELIQAVPVLPTAQPDR
jgi:predicted ATPase